MMKSDINVYTDDAYNHQMRHESYFYASDFDPILIQYENEISDFGYVAVSSYAMNKQVTNTISDSGK